MGRVKGQTWMAYTWEDIMNHMPMVLTGFTLEGSIILWRRQKWKYEELNTNAKYDI